MLSSSEDNEVIFETEDHKPQSEKASKWALGIEFASSTGACFIDCFPGAKANYVAGRRGSCSEIPCNLAAHSERFPPLTLSKVLVREL